MEDFDFGFTREEYDSAQEPSGGSIDQMKPGAYVLKIVRIKTEGETRNGKWTAAEKKYVQVVWDVAEGPHAGRYSEDYFDDPDKDFMHCDYLSWKNQGFLKKKLKAITASNTNPAFDAEAAFFAKRFDMFAGKLFGAVIDGTVDTNDRGYDRWKLRIGDVISAEDARSGNHREPNVTDEREQPSASDSTDVYDDIPFM